MDDIAKAATEARRPVSRSAYGTPDSLLGRPGSLWWDKHSHTDAFGAGLARNGFTSQVPRANKALVYSRGGAA
jgi:hypothetical protein